MNDCWPDRYGKCRRCGQSFVSKWGPARWLQVISALAESGQSRPGAPPPHIPYRSVRCLRRPWLLHATSRNDRAGGRCCMTIPAAWKTTTAASAAVQAEGIYSLWCGGSLHHADGVGMARLLQGLQAHEAAHGQPGGLGAGAYDRLLLAHGHGSGGDVEHAVLRHPRQEHPQPPRGAGAPPLLRPFSLTRCDQAILPGSRQKHKARSPSVREVSFSYI